MAPLRRLLFLLVVCVSQHVTTDGATSDNTLLEKLQLTSLESLMTGDVLTDLLSNTSVADVLLSVQLDGMTRPDVTLLSRSGEVSARWRNVSARCRTSLGRVWSGVVRGERTATTMLDALGKVPSGVTAGNTRWYGQYDLCQTVQEHDPPDPVKACKLTVSKLKLNSTNRDKDHFFITIGLCMPTACSRQDIDKVADATQALLALNATMKSFCETDLDEYFGHVRASDVVLLVVIVVLFILNVLGTVYDMVFVRGCVSTGLTRLVVIDAGPSPIRSSEKAENGSQVMPNGHPEERKEDIGLANIQANYELGSTNGSLNNAAEATTAEQEDIRPLDEDASAENESCTNIQPNVATAAIGQQTNFTTDNPKSTTPQLAGTEKKHWLNKFQWLLCFSVAANVEKLTTVSKARPTPEGVNLSCLYGIRTLSMLWIVVGHTFSSLDCGGDNCILSNGKTARADLISRRSFELINNGTYAVDTFLFMTGFLVTFITLKKLKDVKLVKKFRWGYFYLHRYWRLTPIMMFCLMVWMVGTRFVQGSTRALEVAEYSRWAHDTCSTFWWSNMLYINNVFPFDPGAWCFGHGWYLAVDMQLYVFAPGFIIALYKSPRFGVGLLVTLIVGFCAVRGVLADMLGVPMVAPWGKDVSESTGLGFYLLYFNTSTRGPVFWVGILCGYLLLSVGTKRPLSRVVTVAGWTLTTCLMLTLTLATYTPSGQGKTDPAQSIVWNSLHRVAWSVGLGWIVVACSRGQGGPVHHLLSCGFWQPLSRLTYTVYLVHLTVILHYYLTVPTPIYYTDYNIAVLTIAFVVISNLAAAVLHVCVEAPCIALDKYLVQKYGGRQTKRCCCCCCCCSCASRDDEKDA